MNRQEFLDRYQAGERNFTYIDLSGANLSGVNLQEIDLTGANLTGVNLSWAVLNQTQLVGACFRRADLRNIVLTRSNLNQSNLSGANLTKADLRFATLKQADLNWAILIEADLSNTDLTGAKLDQINLEQAKLNHALLMGTELMEANLTRASLISANLTKANLRESRLSGANLKDAILTQANLTEADLNGAMLRSANLSGADMHRVILTAADLTEAVLDSADLSRGNLMGAYLLKASFKKAYLLRANLEEVYLLWSDLSEANLRGANLRKADLSGAYLSDTILSEADLREALLIESHLIRTNLEGAKLTGCCIHNWEKSDVELAKIECDYVYTQFDYTTKKPKNRYPSDRDFLPGELAHESPEDSNLITVEFTEYPNWEALVYTLVKVEQNSPELQLIIQGFETQPDLFLLQVQANYLVNSKLLAEQILTSYLSMKEKIVQKRSEILELLNLEVPIFNASIDLKQIPAPALPPPPLVGRQNHEALYKEISRQIQSILRSQEPEKFVISVQRLLDFLTKNGVELEDLQHQVIIQGIVQRAQQEPLFKDNLFRWEQTASPTERVSVMGELVRFAIALLWEK
ncbi:Pentapeptide repeat protein [Planktothrix serta PCC 8927]|uniref:Pentapeptide repeat protein n=1 Tax=Planktothrix serta PCC 8927 TaxID=671068 RepID=A0A7Z9BU79_9CYAN|nr:pentapeptide repeat-containing protein [Planktothrix serta]VXD22792.1 Pentapeptide repeat protein [Planktothrix serta PCC 8927]